MSSDWAAGEDAPAVRSACLCRLRLLCVFTGGKHGHARPGVEGRLVAAADEAPADDGDVADAGSSRPASPFRSGIMTTLLSLHSMAVAEGLRALCSGVGLRRAPGNPSCSTALLNYNYGKCVTSSGKGEGNGSTNPAGKSHIGSQENCEDPKGPQMRSQGPQEQGQSGVERLRLGRVRQRGRTTYVCAYVALKDAVPAQN